MIKTLECSVRLWNRAIAIGLFLALLPVTGAASEEEIIPWQAITVKSPAIPEIGAVTVEASTEGRTFKELKLTAFGRSHTLDATELKRLESFPLASLTLTHDPGYAQLGGHTLYLRLTRVYHDQSKTLMKEVVVISVPRHGEPTVSEQKAQ